MESSGEIQIEIEDARIRFTLSELWDDEFPSLWRSPSSPPYRPPSPTACSPSTSQRSTAADQPPSSPSTQSEFEFDPRAVADARDDLPVSPKFLSWTAAPHPEHSSSAHQQISSLSADFMAAGRRPDESIDLSKQGVSSPASSSRRSDLSFYSAITTSPARPRASKQVPSGLLSERQEKQAMGAHAGCSARERRSLSEAMDTAPYPTTTGRRGLGQSKSSIASSSSSSWFAMHAWDLKNEEERSSKKASPCRSLKRWAFKDLLRRTVPSSKADAHFIAKTFQAPPSPSKCFSSSSSKHRSTPSSPQASYPIRSHIDPTWRSSTLPLVHPSSHTAAQSPSHHRSSTRASSFAYSSTTSTHSEAHMPQHASTTPSQSPTPSPPQSPISQHVAHYRSQKAQSQELGKKTFLPYRRSLLGCLGGSRAFSSNQLVW